MADFNDEFDVELENAIFEIEGSDSEEFQVKGNGGNDRKRDIAVQSGTELSLDKDGSLPRQLSCGSATNSMNGLSLKSAGSIKSQSNGLDNSDPQMEDGFDDLLSQIDENVINNLSKETGKPSKPDHITNRGAHLIKKPVRSSENSPLKRSFEEENSSFFLSQNSDSGQAPLKRRFPGPAGILPQLKREELKCINMEPHPLYEKVSKIVAGDSPIVTCRRMQKPRQATDNTKVRGNELLLSKAPWKALIETLKLNIKNENDLLNILNTKWIRKNAKRFPKDKEMKMPFLAAVVQEKMEIPSTQKFRHKSPSVRLMDPSGTIVAAFHPSFVEAFGDKIVPGTALALRNCGVLRFKKCLILRVAKKNLLCLTTTKESNEEDEESQDKKDLEDVECIKTDNGVLVMKAAPFELNKILEEHKDISNKLVTMKEDHYDLTETSSHFSSFPTEQRGLFSTVRSASAIETRTKPFTSPYVPGHTVPTTSSSLPVQQLQNGNVAHFDDNATSEFDDEDDSDLLQALEYVNFVLEDDSL